MKKKKFYRFIAKDDRRLGVIYAPKGTDTCFGEDTLPVENYESMVFTLKNGAYAPFMVCNVSARFVNEDFKQLIEEVIPEGYPLEFLPVTVVSEEHGNIPYYILHFTKIFDVIDQENSVRLTSTGSITKPYLYYEKAEELDFFNSVARINGVMVSDKMMKLMKKRKLDIGIQFHPVHYVGE